MRQLFVLIAIMSALSSRAAADTGVYIGGGARWSEDENRVALVLRGSTSVAPFLSLGLDLYGLCTGGRDLDLDFGGGALSLMLSPPALGPVDFELGLEVGVVPLHKEVHGRDGLPVYAGFEAAVSLGLGAGVGLRLAYDQVLTSSDAKRALNSQLLLMIGLRI